METIFTSAFLTTAASVATSVIAVGSFIRGRGGDKGGGVPARRGDTAGGDTAGPVARSTADVEAGERQRQSVFKRLSKLRRATLISERSAAEPQILNTKLSGT